MAEPRLKPQTTSDLASKAQSAAGDMTYRETVIQDTSTKMTMDDLINRAVKMVNAESEEYDTTNDKRVGGSFDEDAASKAAGERMIPGEDDKNKRKDLCPYI